MLTLLAAFWLWFLLPVAVIYQRRARREVEHSGGYYVWPNNLLNRPILLWLIVLAGILAMVMAMALVGIYGDP